MHAFIQKVARKLGAVSGRVGCRIRASRVGQVTEIYLDQFIYRFNNVNFDCETNGEIDVIKCVASCCGSRQVYLDVGANVGEWSALVLKYANPIALHAFEPHLATYDLLVKSNKSPVFNAHPFGLGDEEGQRLLYSHGVGDVGASFVDWQLATEWESGSQATSCQIRRGDSFLENIGSSKVTLLKIDVEGYELQVLRGFGKRIRDVRCIQFEYGVPNIHSRTLLRDLVLYLESLGFMVGRIFPKGVRFGRWSPVSERFMGNNYVAVGNEDENLITSLQGLFNNSRDSHAL